MIHIFCDRIVSNDGLMCLIGRTDFSVAPGRGDGKTDGGGPDPRDPGMPRGRMLAHRALNAVPDEEELLRRHSHNFH